MTPSNAYNPFPRKVQMEITAQMVQKWIKDEALQDFLDYLTIANPCVLSGYRNLCRSLAGSNIPQRPTVTEPSRRA